MFPSRSVIAILLAILCLAACAAEEADRQLSAGFLTGTAALHQAVSTSEFVAGNHPPSNTFEGTLSFTASNKLSHIEVLKDDFAITQDAKLLARMLPHFSVELIQHGNSLLPVRRGLQRTQHPYWDYMIEPGKVWQDPADGDWSRASVPFALNEKNQNCLHNGLLTFLYKDDGSISRLAYQIGSETCQYLHINLWGVASADYQQQKSNHRDETITSWQQEFSSRPNYRSLEQLIDKYPDIDLSKLVPQATADTTVYGLIVDGEHYRSSCTTRYGPYPYCEEIDLPSYSLAKSIFAGLAYMMMVKKWPEFEYLTVSSLVPECRLADGRWDEVTTRQLLNMMSGNHASSDYSSDEDSAAMSAFFLAEVHADKLHFSCEQWPKQQPPGTQFAYHSTDHYLLGTAMNVYLRQKQGPQADIFNDLIDVQIFKPLKLSSTSGVSLRSYDQTAQPFTAYGLFFKPSDIAKLAGFLNGGSKHPDLFRAEDFDAATFRSTDKINRLKNSKNEAYNLGFWGYNITQQLGCSGETWIPFMSGYGGIVFALLPNGISYYYFTDGGHKPWKNAAIEINNISNYCKES